MATKTSKTISKSTSKTGPTYPRKGLLFALAVIPAGVAAWLFLWQFGFIASVVAWAIAGGAVWLYSYGAKGEVTKTVLPWLLLIMFAGILIAFLSGVISDLRYGYTTELDGTQGFFSREFWTLVWDNLTYWDFLSQYIPDFLISLAFAALGAGGVVYGLVKQNK